ncbi:adenine nucleotide alpha hydrolases-like protein [Polychaeton citri CBS 116435]|uniref:Diphthine--ammonia ligase n=1 Tax=Polychaeton citri CBS 116435 TaxID=1314669 RepID=A0A9P4QIU6_9PEZI|nr:adenine nucleotide alpha hydrolases-like protein [Polychaeton citri CBS 116435]
MGRLKVVALISGGKDSLFSILHCLANAHDVVALANLHPPNRSGDAAEDLDSFMYQTVGHKVIPLYAEALGLPLYRQEIQGTAIVQSKEYQHDTRDRQHGHDETEDLFQLLQRVKSTQPDVDAVSTGAILSDYQRIRVEHVALRLGLTPLSFLWQYPSLPPNTQHSLLDDMAAVGQDSRIIKIASGGLDESFLWQNVASKATINRLIKASKRFGTDGDGAILGEGGEFETLALEGPVPLWKARIVIEDGDTEILSGEAGTASVKIVRSQLGSHSTPSTKSTIDNLRQPPLLESSFEALLSSGNNPSKPVEDPPSGIDRVDERPQNQLLLEGLTGSGQTAAEQTENVMQQLQLRLQQHGLDMNSVAYTCIILRDMVDFAAVNKAYSQHFIMSNPPARVTIASPTVIPAQASIMLSATAVRMADPKELKNLHVQSRSYWAPANIGPYSQAVIVPVCGDSSRSDTLVYVSGQIPLVPNTMDLVQSDPSVGQHAFTLQAVLSLQHLYRIATCVRARQWVRAIAFITADSPEEASDRAEIARSIWFGSRIESGTESEEVAHADDFDIWHLRFNAAGHDTTSVVKQSSLREAPLPSVFVIRVDALPRSASIEWVGYGSTNEETKVWEVPHFEYLLSVFQSAIVA